MDTNNNNNNNDVNARNRETSIREVESFRTRAEHSPYTAYLSSDGKRITTWMGDTLAHVVGHGRTYRSNFGNKVTPFRTVAIDGREYFGRHNGPGMYLRMRPAKAK